MRRVASSSTTPRADGPSTAQTRLSSIARRIADAYITHTEPRAVLLTGSVAEGLADELSDIDLIVYYDAQPPQAALERAHAQIGSTDVELKGYGAKFRVDEVECEVGHFRVEETERRLSTVLDDHEVDTLVHKHLMGITAGQALYGESLIQSWQGRAADFPESLRQRMAEFYVNRQFAFWYIEGHWHNRDAHLWLHQVLVETGVNILGALAGINRLYFSPFQFKRLREFVSRMQFAPLRLADRLDQVFLASEPEAMREAEQLFRETLELAEQQLPGLDTAGLRHRPGQRGQR
jgi:predicted nucleotidyltransferase